MGSGKTTVGEITAALLGCGFIDSDREIIAKGKFKSIAEIFENEGEKAFRAMESEIASELAELNPPLVIATGGGMITNADNMKNLASNAIIFYLETSFDTIQSRVQKQINESKLIRPLFSDSAKVKELYEQRLPLYRKYAQVTIQTDNRLPREIAKEIIKSAGIYANQR